MREEPDSLSERLSLYKPTRATSKTSTSTLMKDNLEHKVIPTIVIRTPVRGTANACGCSVTSHEVFDSIHNYDKLVPYVSLIPKISYIVLNDLLTYLFDSECNLLEVVKVKELSLRLEELVYSVRSREDLTRRGFGTIIGSRLETLKRITPGRVPVFLEDRVELKKIEESESELPERKQERLKRKRDERLNKPVREYTLSVTGNFNQTTLRIIFKALGDTLRGIYLYRDKNGYVFGLLVEFRMQIIIIPLSVTEKTYKQAYECLVLKWR